AFLQGVQQFFLCGSRQFTNFAEKQCSAVGLNEFVAMLFSSACKSAFLVPEQCRLDQVLGQSAAINRDKRLRAPRAAAMDRARSPLSRPRIRLQSKPV